MTQAQRSVLVTGSGRGIGFEIACVLAARGYHLHLVTATLESAEKLRDQPFVINSKAVVHQLDQSDRGAINAFAKAWDDRLWAIVNNAGICKTLDLKSSGVDPFDEVLATNLVGPYLLTKTLLAHLSRPGRIVNIASQLGHDGRAGYSAYCASKFGLIGLTKCWAKELGSDGITVNAVCPGWVDTEMSRRDLSRLASQRDISPASLYADICRPLELKRFNSPNEVAQLVSFLLSDEASGVTGRDWLMQSIWN